MSEVVLTDGPKTPDGFARSIARFLRETGNQAKRSGGIQAKNSTRLLDLTANYIEGLDDNDRLLRSLYRCQLGHGSNPNEYSPGSRQGRVIGNAGFKVDGLPEPHELFAEMVDAAIEDHEKALNDRNRTASDRARANAQRSARDKIEAATNRAAQKVNVLTGRVAKLERERAELERENGYLKLFQSPETNGDEAKPKGKPRRKAVEGSPNVYTTASGFEIGWTEDGKRRWQSLGEVTLDEAVALQREKVDAQEGVPA